MDINAEEHRRRLQNLKETDMAVKSCMREHWIYNYDAGQVHYNMGEYPKRFSMAPAEDDEKLLKELAGHKVTVIGIHEEWNDPLRVLGATKHTAHDPRGLKSFVKLAHSLGMKVIPYASTGYFYIHDPDFKPEWTSFDFYLFDLYCKYAQCSPASPEWRAYLLPRLEYILDEYGVDGFYNDMGVEPLWYYQFAKSGPYPPDFPYEYLPFKSDRHFSHVSPKPETPGNDSAMEDLLGIVYGMIKKRGGIYKIHAGGARQVNYKNRAFDYLWVGEGSENYDDLRLTVMNHTPYVVPCPDLGVLKKDDELFLHFIPFMQFPLGLVGRPFTGERATVPGIEYGDQKPTTRHCRRVWQYLKEHPDAPPSYGYWDSCPGRPNGKKRWLYYLDLYLPMVKDGTRAALNIKDSVLFRRKPSADVVYSLFVNDEIYMVMANYGQTPAEVACTWNWRNRESGTTGSVLTIPPRGLSFLQRTDSEVFFTS